MLTQAYRDEEAKAAAKEAAKPALAAADWEVIAKGYLKGGEKEAFAFLDALKIAKLAVSLGGTETLASAPAAMTHLSVPDERKQALGISDNLVRISIGVEKAEDLIADFDNALRSV